MPAYLRNRYGQPNAIADAAWEVLNKTVFNGKVIRDGAESIIAGRLTLDSATVWTKIRLNYNPKDLLPAWKLMVEASDAMKNSCFFISF
ncbi:MAG: alpha-N-acetylglucosaminidase C-terminal domain-containing protein [Pedobacter sp.]|uniref:alpha-N-acetylglucosaminidase C-terminal domain-containing protein n=1 Tax=Pedobacter sp. TaxID=1411316 RepID=UPI003391D5ED